MVLRKGGEAFDCSFPPHAALLMPSCLTDPTVHLWLDRVGKMWSVKADWPMGHLDPHDWCEWIVQLECSGSP